jgi:integrase
MQAIAQNTLGESGRPWTVADALADYLAYLENERRTAKDTKYKIDAFILPSFGGREIASLTVDELRKWLADLAKSPPRLRTAKTGKNANAQRFRALDQDDEDTKRRRRAPANRVWTIFKAALNHAYNDDKVASDECWRRVRPFGKVGAARLWYLSVPEAQRLVNACSDEFRQLVRAALETGCHYSELSRLLVHDFNPDAGTIHIRRGKSGKGRHIVLSDEGAYFFAQITAGRIGEEIMLQNRTVW